MYYSAMIFFLGAEFTHALAERRGKQVVPTPGARQRQAEPPRYQTPARA